MKVREAIRIIESDGWYQVATRGSRRQFKHPIKPGRDTIAGKTVVSQFEMWHGLSSPCPPRHALERACHISN